jgi:hypothetical protein
MSHKSATPMQPNSISNARNKILSKSGTLLSLRQAQGGNASVVGEATQPRRAEVATV